MASNTYLEPGIRRWHGKVDPIAFRWEEGEHRGQFRLKEKYAFGVVTCIHYEVRGHVDSASVSVRILRGKEIMFGVTDIEINGVFGRNILLRFPVGLGWRIEVRCDDPDQAIQIHASVAYHAKLR